MYFSWLEYHPDKMGVAGSSPAKPTKLIVNKEILRIIIDTVNMNLDGSKPSQNKKKFSL